MTTSVDPARLDPAGSTIPASLVICSRNRPGLLFDTVTSVLEGDERPAELIVVDQSDLPHAKLGGMPGSGGCKIRYLHVSSRGLSRARNQGIASSTCPITAIIDDDMFVERDWFGTLIRALLAAPQPAVVTGQVLPAVGEVRGGFVPALVSSPDPAVYEGRLDRDVLAGGHMAAFRTTLEEMHGFDERLGAGSEFPAADDNDLGFRLLEAGYRIVYVPEAVVHHRAWRPASEYVTMRWRYGKGKGGFYAKYAGGRDGHMRRRMLKDIGRRVVGFPGRVLADRRGALGDVAYCFGVVVGACQWTLTSPRM